MPQVHTEQSEPKREGGAVMLDIIESFQVFRAHSHRLTAARNERLALNQAMREAAMPGGA